MAIATELSELEFEFLYDQIEAKVAEAASEQYSAAVEKATTPKEKKACAGHYPSAWSEMFENWLTGNLDNQLIYESILHNRVLKQDELTV
jgi:hypothetical protein